MARHLCLRGPTWTSFCAAGVLERDADGKFASGLQPAQVHPAPEGAAAPVAEVRSGRELQRARAELIQIRIAERRKS